MKCDCGKPADKKDGSGFSCPECRSFISRCSRIITTLIIEQRGMEFFDDRINGKQRKYLKHKYGNAA